MPSTHNWRTQDNLHTYDSICHFDNVTKCEFLQCGATWHAQHTEQLVPVVLGEHLTTNILEQR